MSESEIVQGKAWIENKLRAIAAEFGAGIETANWGRAGDDFSRGLETLAYVIAGKRHLETFSEEEMEDCPNDQAVKARLERRLRQSVKSASSPTPKIGFNRT